MYMVMDIARKDRKRSWWWLLIRTNKTVDQVATGQASDVNAQAFADAQSVKITNRPLKGWK